MFTLTQQDAQASNAVVAGTISVCFLDARVLLDPGATHSFVSPVFTSKSDWLNDAKDIQCYDFMAVTIRLQTRRFLLPGYGYQMWYLGECVYVSVDVP